jgi:hypothetical protein
VPRVDLAHAEPPAGRAPELVAVAAVKVQDRQIIRISGQERRKRHTDDHVGFRRRTPGQVCDLGLCVIATRSASKLAAQHTNL